MTEMDSKHKKRPEVLPGKTYKLKVPNHNDELINTYITINDDEHGQPFEIFINGFDPKLHEWLSLSMVFISRLLRIGVDPQDIIDDLHSIHSATGGHFIPGGKGISPSLASRIGDVLESHIK